MIYRLLDYFAVMCFAVAMPQRSERLPPPRNLSYVWIDHFHVNMTWRRPDPVVDPGCPLKYVANENGPMVTTGLLSRSLLVVGLSSDFRYTVKCTTTDDGPCTHYDDSEEVSIVVPRQVPLVTDFKFSHYPPCDKWPTQTCGLQATWIPANGTSEIQVFYGVCTKFSLENRCRGVLSNPGEPGQVCHLVNITTNGDDVCILFKGPDGQHTFQGIPTNNIRTHKPNVKVTEQNHSYLNVSWQHGIVGREDCWNYSVNYTECGRTAEIKRTDNVNRNSVLVPFNKDCRYELQVSAQIAAYCGVQLEGNNASLVYNDNPTKDHSMIVAVIATPGILSVLVVMACCYVRRKRNSIFKTIPVPPSSLKEMMSSIQQGQALLFLAAPEEVEVCRVTLVPAKVPLWGKDTR